MRRMRCGDPIAAQRAVSGFKNKLRLNLKTNDGIIEDTNGLLIDVKTNSGITNDTNGLSQTYLITDAINGIERISTVGTNKDKIQSRY